MLQKKREKKLGVAVVLLANVFFEGWECPNLGVVNVRILGVVNVLLANDSQSFACNVCDAAQSAVSNDKLFYFAPLFRINIFPGLTLALTC